MSQVVLCGVAIGAISKMEWGNLAQNSRKLRSLQEYVAQSPKDVCPKLLLNDTEYNFLLLGFTEELLGTPVLKSSYFRDFAASRICCSHPKQAACLYSSKE